MATSPKNIRYESRFTPLDRIDRLLLRALQNNARASNKELAELAGLAPSSCLDRLRRLRERGVLKGFHAEIDLAAIDRTTQAIIAVRLGAHSRAEIDLFYDHALELPEVLAAFHVSGADDYLLHTAVRDTERLRKLVLELTTRPEVQHVETHLVFDHVRKSVVEPLDE